ncbi:cardiac phospholamban isoform X1 [Gambusia affinis]|uniref:cardiac phospholamban isoform X1 n=1 Tax=Gambusia affinis TaxID=33528 RepID=UPI001CDC5E8F|nr:cardiac phospholamban isoform X1 [Gambusia affinis]
MSAGGCQEDEDNREGPAAISDRAPDCQGSLRCVSAAARLTWSGRFKQKERSKHSDPFVTGRTRGGNSVFPALRSAAYLTLLSPAPTGSALISARRRKEWTREFTASSFNSRTEPPQHPDPD